MCKKSKLGENWEQYPKGENSMETELDSIRTELDNVKKPLIRISSRKHLQFVSQKIKYMHKMLIYITVL